MKLDYAIKRVEEMKRALSDKGVNPDDYKIVMSKAEYKELVEDSGMKYGEDIPFPLTILGLPIEIRPLDVEMMLIKEVNVWE